MKGWSDWSALYYPSDFEVKTLETHISNLAESKILEIGCGDGRVTEKLKERCSSIYAIDVEKSLIEELAKAQGKIDYRAMSGLDLEFEADSFDLVLYCWSLHQIKPMKKTLEEAYRCLKKDGHLVIFGLTRKGEYDEVVEAFEKDPGDHVESYGEHISSIEAVFGSISLNERIGDDGEFGFFFESDQTAIDNWLWSLANWHEYEVKAGDKPRLLDVIKRYRQKSGYFLRVFGNLLIARK
ncbi:MAG: methyltransferase domain-containing protein [Cryomorphaceae bacterium]|nr:methyltransferase domain-containing protein [Cryomorphaceae bacterium]